MACALRNSGKIRIVEGNNDISQVKSLDIRIRHDEIVSAMMELYPEEIFVEVDALYTEINGIKYRLIRVDECKVGDS